MHDVADLQRAIKYTSQAPDTAAQQYIVRRARELGHADLLPTSWTRMNTTLQSTSLDEQLEHLSSRHDLSTAQLKTVYMRGVNDFLESDITYGSATMYGLARVQRFITERGANIDTDLLPVTETQQVDTGIELGQGSFFSLDVIYSSGHSLAELFQPGSVTAITVHDNDTLIVEGEISNLSWVYMLDTVTGAHLFEIQ